MLKDDRVLDSDIVKNSVVVLAVEPPKEILVVAATPDASPTIPDNIDRVKHWTDSTSNNFEQFPPSFHSSSASNLSDETSSQRSSSSVSSPNGEGSSSGTGAFLKLPDFTSGVTEALLKNESAEVWSQVVTQTVDYYRRFFPHRLQSSEDYRLLGQMMLRKYPTIARFGKQPWSAFTHAVSSRMRSIRHQNKRKMEQESNNTEGGDMSIPSSKRKLCMVQNVELQNDNDLLSNEEYEAHRKEMLAEVQKDNVGVSHLRHMLRITRDTRLAINKKFKDRLMYNVIRSAPALQRGDMILEEFKMLKGWTDKEMEDAYTRVCNMVDGIKKFKNFKWSTQEMSDAMAVRYLEKEVGFKKGRGGKYQNSLEMKWEVDDDSIGKELEKCSYEDDSPHLVVFSNSENVVLISLVGDKTTVNIDGTDVRNSLLILISLYYILDMRFPRCYSQFLGILQEVVILDKYKGPCSTGMIEWMSKLR